MPKLSDKAIAAMQCPDGKKDKLVFDTDQRKLGIRLTASGAKVFVMQWTTPNGKRRYRIGRWGEISLKDARREAERILGEVAARRDPVSEAKARDQAARQAKTDAEYTFGHLIESWAAARRADRRESYLREAVACCRRNLDEWWKRPASSITARDAVRALDGVKARKGVVAANRTLAYSRAAYSWATKRLLLPSNPMRGIERAGREMARERVLEASELAAIWRACDRLNPTWAGFVRTLMLTLQRREEVAAMCWSELSSDLSTWVLPGERAKNHRTHVVHLSKPVRAILKRLPKAQGNPFVFRGRAGKPISGFGSAKDQIGRALSEQGVILADWRFHDFRRAGVTALADLGVPPHIADRLLNHVTGAIQGVAAVYQKHEFLAERRAAHEAWAEHVLAAVDGREPDRKLYPREVERRSNESNVVPFESVRR